MIPVQEITRRTLLSGLVLAAGATVMGASGLALTAAEAAELPRWSEPSTWGAAGVPTEVMAAVQNALRVPMPLGLELA